VLGKAQAPNPPNDEGCPQRRNKLATCHRTKAVKPILALYYSGDGIRLSATICHRLFSYSRQHFSFLSVVFLLRNESSGKHIV
jgi:hypothetical protein